MIVKTLATSELNNHNCTKTEECKTKAAKRRVLEDYADAQYCNFVECALLAGITLKCSECMRARVRSARYSLNYCLPVSAEGGQLRAVESLYHTCQCTVVDASAALS